MKRIVSTIMGIIVCMSLILQVTVYGETGVTSIDPGELRGLWVATVYNIDYPVKATTDANVLKKEAVTILDHAQYMGLNAIFLQVRPSGDALYPSKYFPWSKYLTGKQGTAPSANFDPLGFWIEEAHKRGIELHAWINPYRITRKGAAEPAHDFTSLVASHPANQNPSWVLKHTDGNLYFDPGVPEVRQFLVDSVLEIIENYDIDGIHLDDYFYPGKNVNDQGTYKKYGQAFGNIEDWRRENVNLLVGDLYTSIKAADRDVRFGISPFGIWANRSANPLGSDTKGTQSYYDHYADTRKWVKEGMLDYIAPQLYWNIGYEIADYSKLLNWWTETVKDTDVDLYVGQAAYKAGNADAKSPWHGVLEIQKQLELNMQHPEVRGSIYYNYNSLAKQPTLTTAIKEVYEEKNQAIANIPVRISRPSDHITTEQVYYYVSGVSDPKMPLYVNGRQIESRSGQGVFGTMVRLNVGKNTITISQGSSSDTRVIYRNIYSVSERRKSTQTDRMLSQIQEFRIWKEKLSFIE